MTPSGVTSADGSGLPSQPLIAVDVVPMRWSAEGLAVGVARREFEPFAGRFALPGVLLGAGESLDDAAARALRTKAGIGRERVRHRFQIGAFDGPDRDPRRHAISIASAAVIDPAAEPATDDLRWEPVTEVPSLPFDHDLLVAETVRQLRTRLWHDDAVTRALTGPRFSTPDAVRLTAAVTGEEVHQSNLRRSLAAHAGLSSAPAPESAGRGRRPLVWAWSD
ncbi:MAG: NUDIX hydrolase [Gordonia sp. (in: high G+C Gram-positive bacteria)]|uniref:NUDIX domain-containing protein n=1 Tax=Gordonia sp. (in: high G+C Gram-positive bacteria) TaxID=84139 RepID=UPI0039E35335